MLNMPVYTCCEIQPNALSFEKVLLCLCMLTNGFSCTAWLQIIEMKLDAENGKY